MIRGLSALLLGLALSLPAAADSIWGEFDKLDLDDVPLAEDENRFAGRVELGYIAARGNTVNTNMNAKVFLGLETIDWRHGWAALGIYSRDRTSTTAENYRAGYKADRKLDDQNYLFGAFSWEQNEFAGFSQRLTQAIGYGRRLYKSDRQHLDAEIGFGARQTDLVDDSKQRETIGRLALNYFVQIAENSEFSHQMAVESGDFNTYVESRTSVASQLIGELDLVATYVIQRNSTVPEGRENRDTYTTVNVRYRF